MAMKTYILSLWALLMTLLLAVVSCTGGHGQYRIGVSQCSQDDWRMKVNDEIQREMIFHDNASVEIRSAQDNNARQIADIRYFIDNGFDAIIVAPNEAEAITPVIAEAYRKGIPVVVFDRDINGDTYTAKIQVDNEAIGKEAAQYARRIVDGQLNVLELQGLRGSSPASTRHSGFVEEIGRMADSRIAASVYADWYELDAEKATDSLLRQHPDVNVIFAHNDRMAIGASRSARKQGRRDIKIIGIDAAPNLGIRAVADSVIDATFFYPTEGHLLVQTVMKILQGEPYDSKVMIPALPAVDRSNAAIMLRQDDVLSSETAKMLEMTHKANRYSSKYSAQTAVLIVSALLILTLFAFIFVLVRSSRMQKESRKELAARNDELMRQRDKQRELYRRLDAATQSKLVFFTNVSHDLRTPLTLISEPVRALARSGHIDDEEREMLRIADRNIDILHRLINQILDFRKFESGKLDIHPKEVRPADLLRHWLESFGKVARSRRVKLELNCNVEAGAESMALDDEKIERVVYNLVSNALKYTPDGGRINISLDLNASLMELRVRDNGIGIDADKLEHVFEQFYQADDQGSGSGIGLSLAKAFVELHGGTIAVTSAPGSGAEFTVRIPVTHIESEASDAVCMQESEPEDSGDSLLHGAVGADDRPVVLVIDDNADICTLLARMLEDRYSVITASDGMDGYEKAVRYVPDLILCDVMMPVMDGLECCRRIKASQATSHIPVLMLTARSLDEQRVEGYDSGADAYISKPFRRDVLLSRCRNLLDNRRRIRDVFGADKASAPKTAIPVEVPGGVRTDLEDEFYRRFIDIVTPRLSDAGAGIESIASEIGLSQSQLNRKIKALTGITPVELIRGLRLAMARRMLLQTECPVSEVASACGFTSHAYFSKCYRDAYGQSPSEVRSGRNNAGAKV